MCSASIENQFPGFFKGSGWGGTPSMECPSATASRNRRETVSGNQSENNRNPTFDWPALRSVVSLEKLWEITIVVDCDVLCRWRYKLLRLRWIVVYRVQ
ncbi:MAG: hypothetical protein CM15mP58_23300 [Burkholderiaceae bacterium]|nr:MAG: hypothetical protein CM15mP58_23300 [Burkholderiaceae bacterium]